MTITTFPTCFPERKKGGRFEKRIPYVSGRREVKVGEQDRVAGYNPTPRPHNLLAIEHEGRMYPFLQIKGQPGQSYAHSSADWLKSCTVAEFDACFKEEK